MEAIELDRITKTELTEKLQHITGLENPNSVIQMREWLASKGMETDTLDKKAVAELLKDAPPELMEVPQSNPASFNHCPFNMIVGVDL